MTNEQVTELLRAAQQFWKKYRDNPPDTKEGCLKMMAEAGKPLEGLPPHAFRLMQFFTDEIAIRAQEGGPSCVNAQYLT